VPEGTEVVIEELLWRRCACILCECNCGVEVLVEREERDRTPYDACQVGRLELQRDAEHDHHRDHLQHRLGRLAERDVSGVHAGQQGRGVSSIRHVGVATEGSAASPSAPDPRSGTGSVLDEDLVQGPWLQEVPLRSTPQTSGPEANTASRHV
jgi:hypothetical protein